jgi:hypothetical protein
MRYIHSVLGILLVLYSFINMTDFGLGEWMVCATFFPIPIIAWYCFKKDLTGMLFSGMLLGVTIEYITEIYWDYSLHVYLWRDISLFVIMGWGYNFTFYILLSGFFIRKVTKIKDDLRPDPKLILFDMFLGPVWFLSNEFLGMKVLHLWTYSKATGWTNNVSWLWNYPMEGILGAFFLCITLPSFVRFGANAFSATGKIDQRNISRKCL